MAGEEEEDTGKLTRFTGMSELDTGMSSEASGLDAVAGAGAATVELVENTSLPVGALSVRVTRSRQNLRSTHISQLLGDKELEEDDEDEEDRDNNSRLKGGEDNNRRKRLGSSQSSSGRLGGSKKRKKAAGDSADDGVAREETEPQDDEQGPDTGERLQKSPMFAPRLPARAVAESFLPVTH